MVSRNTFIGEFNQKIGAHYGSYKRQAAICKTTFIVFLNRKFPEKLNFSGNDLKEIQRNFLGMVHALVSVSDDQIMADKVDWLDPALEEDIITRVVTEICNPTVLPQVEVARSITPSVNNNSPVQSLPVLAYYIKKSESKRKVTFGQAYTKFYDAQGPLTQEEVIGPLTFVSPMQDTLPDIRESDDFKPNDTRFGTLSPEEKELLKRIDNYCHEELGHKLFETSIKARIYYPKLALYLINNYQHVDVTRAVGLIDNCIKYIRGYVNQNFDANKNSISIKNMLDANPSLKLKTSSLKNN